MQPPPISTVLPPVTLSPNPAQAATKAVLVVTDQAGRDVSRTELPLGTGDYAWQGRDAQGKALPKGVYTLTLESWQGDKILDTSAVEHYGKISEIRSTSDGVSALLPGRFEALLSAITAIWERVASYGRANRVGRKTGLDVAGAKFHIGGNKGGQYD